MNDLKCRPDGGSVKRKMRFSRVLLIKYTNTKENKKHLYCMNLKKPNINIRFRCSFQLINQKARHTYIPMLFDCNQCN